MRAVAICVFFIGILILDYSCEKKHECTTCFYDIMEEFKYSACDSASVKEYIFLKEKVYVFDEGQCGTSDVNFPVYNSSCNHLGDLGGFIGENKINGIDFYQNAEFSKIFWKK